MPSLPAAFPFLVAGAAALTGIAVAAPGSVPGQQRLPHGTVATSAGPRRVATVLPAESPTGVPPGPAGGPLATTPHPGTGPRPSLGAAAPTRTGSGSLTRAGAPTSAGFGWPVPGTPSVLRAFAPGPHPWSPGHRGVDVAGAGSTVLAAGTGTVTFAGRIAGHGVVVIEHAAGLRTTYEPVSAQVTVGQVVRRGDVIGSLQATTWHGAQGPCLHWGARIGDGYLDPVTLLAPPRRPPVLLPRLIETG